MNGETELDEIIPDTQMRYFIDLKRDFIIQRQRFVFPILSSKGIINGLVGYDYESDFKYIMSISSFTARDNLLFNLQNLDKAYRERVLIIIEGVFDSLRLNEVGRLNNISLLGKKMTNYKLNLINRFDLVVLIPDNDEQGIKSSEYWKRGIKTKIATINLAANNYEKIIKEQNEEGDIITKKIETKIKDIDDYLRLENQNNREKFNKVYKKILNDSKGVFFKNKDYFL